MAHSVLRKQIGLKKRIDEFLDQVSEASLLFKQGVSFYIEEKHDQFEEKLKQISTVEHHGDEMRRAIERQLYLKTLIPESRGDVLQLLEQLDTLLDCCKEVLWQFQIELPEVPFKSHDDMQELVSYSVESVEAIVRSARAFFRSSDVSDHLHKVSYWESESDKVTTRMLMDIYRRDDLSLCHKSQLKDLVRQVAQIADRAEDVADRLTIYVIKRML
ncbi:DUF47 domain-containing protein [Halodesulfovibrio spirochaetisodalis]|uniref:Phosphate transport regulator n=1 Tax=Halodesulfovibrio spirochaetisodalis TaxID=1560234 RepID=A0A1B7XAE9_9BACT|nr:DUF47 family protein [Halodesulfovibrio spirochaetisodalis]OBQ46363.1 hypothetical protein SP90_13220 [Halodesulfovibrio spirochaetisodalis]